MWFNMVVLVGWFIFFSFLLFISCCLYFLQSFLLLFSPLQLCLHFLPLQLLHLLHFHRRNKALSDPARTYPAPIRKGREGKGKGREGKGKEGKGRGKEGKGKGREGKGREEEGDGLENKESQRCGEGIFLLTAPVRLPSNFPLF